MVYSEEVAAFYDPKTKTMHLIEESKKPTGKKPGLLERLFGKAEGFDKDENKTVIAHELTHALADQNFDLEKLQKSVKKDDDRSLAVSALIEGEATLAMYGAGMDDWHGDAITKLPAENLDWTFNLIAPFMAMMGGGKAIRNAPPIVSESMTFPYFRGMVFCAKLTNTGGWAAIDEVYRDPPLSTEQILHPEKYRERPDYPMAIELGGLAPGSGWKEVGRNVLGEFQLSVLMKKHGGKSAAAGWDGDRYAVFESPDHKLALVWFTTWDTVDDAREFLKDYAAQQNEKVENLGSVPGGKPDSVWRNDGETLYIIERHGSDVVVIEGFSPESTVTLLRSALQSQKKEIKPASRKQEDPGKKPGTVSAFVP